MSPSPWYLVGSTLSYVEVIIIRVNVWKCPSEDKTILILFYKTYINKKLSDCLVGVFGVDSEKVNLVGSCCRREINPNLGRRGPSDRRRMEWGTVIVLVRVWRSGEVIEGTGATPD